MIEVYEHFKDHLQHRRSKKLDDITAINSGMTSREGYDEEEQFEDVEREGLDIEITDFISKVRREVENATSKERQITVEVEYLGPEENNAGVDPLPDSCQLLLVDLRQKIRSDIDSVLRE